MQSVEIQDLILRELSAFNGLSDGYIWVSLYLLKEIGELRHIDDLKLEENINALQDKGFINIIGLPLKEGSLFSLTPEGLNV